MKILMVDDDNDLCQLTQLVLTEQGYQVSICHSAIMAIEQAKGYKPDLILMDVMLQGTSGADVVKVLKAESQFNETPIIFLTGLISQRQGLNVDGIIYPALGKPFEIDKLLEVIHAYSK